ncbi:hypothetical protein CRUP_014118 [Coryphaenoides rupestris]|nr:hypothetical protein CRUP_014118 [Coryphaenoides rupestris]
MVFNTSLAEPIPDGYQDVADIVPPYSAFSPKGHPEVKNAMLAGAKGIIMFSDPADYSAVGVQVWAYHLLQ